MENKINQSNPAKVAEVLSESEKEIVMNVANLYIKDALLEKYEMENEILDAMMESKKARVIMGNAEEARFVVERDFATYILRKWGIMEMASGLSVGESLSKEELAERLAESAEMRNLLKYIRENGTDIKYHSVVDETLAQMEGDDIKAFRKYIPTDDMVITFEMLGLPKGVQAKIHKVIEKWFDKAENTYFGGEI